MPKAFLFDYGGVITHAGGAVFEPAERLGKVLGMSADEANLLIEPVWEDYSKGKLSESALWEAVEAGYGYSIPRSKRAIWNVWDAEMQPLPEMIDLIAGLQADGYPVGLLSNVIPNTEAEIRENGGYDIFDFLVLSCDVGFIKPNPEIYLLVLDELPGIKPSEVVFVDDQERCLIPARALGMRTILAENPAQVAADIDSMLSM